MSKKKQETHKAKKSEEPKVTQTMSANDEALEKFRTLFIKTDKKRAGKISVSEFRDLLKNNFEDIDPNVLSEVNDAADDYGNVTQESYLNFMKVNFLDSEEEDVIRAFKVFDRANNGYLACAEFKHILTTLGDKFTEEEVEEVFREANLRGDGKLNYVEFVEFWKSK